MANNHPTCNNCGKRHNPEFTCKIENLATDFIESPRSIQILRITQRLDGLNDVIQADRTHWSKGAALKKSNMEVIMWDIIQQKIKKIGGPAHYHFQWIEPSAKRDPDNVISAKKFIFDALQHKDHPIITNDNMKNVLSIIDEWRVTDNPKEVGVIVTITEA
jgi:hypothetical protein